MAGRRRGQIIAREEGKRCTRWTIRISMPPDAAGKRRTWNDTIHGTKADAEKALTAALKRLDEGRLEDPSDMPLSKWLDEWLESIQADRRERSVEVYRRLVRCYLTPALGAIRLVDLKPLDIQRTITEMQAGKYSKGRPLTGTTIRLAIGRLKHALEDARRLRLIPSNPAEDVNLPKGTRPGPKRVLTREEAGSLVAAFHEHRLEALVALSLATGLRPGEAIALRWEDVDQESLTLHVRHSLWNAPGGKDLLTAPKTASSIRKVPLTADLVRLLRSHKARQAEEKLLAGKLYEDQGLVFAGPDGRPLRDSNILRILQRAARKLGLGHLTRHALRHTAATLLVHAGADHRNVSELLGHSDVATTLRFYVKSNEDKLRQGVAILSDVVFQTQPAKKRASL